MLVTYSITQPYKPILATQDELSATEPRKGKESIAMYQDKKRLQKWGPQHVIVWDKERMEKKSELNFDQQKVEKLF